VQHKSLMLTGWESRAEDYRHFKGKKEKKRNPKRIDIACSVAYCTSVLINWRMACQGYELKSQHF